MNEATTQTKNETQKDREIDISWQLHVMENKTDAEVVTPDEVWEMREKGQI